MTPYTLTRRPRTKTIRIVIERHGAVRVSAPLSASEARVRAFVASKESWIAHHVARVAARQALLPSDITDQSLTHFARYKERARLLVTRKARAWGSIMEVSYGMIRVKRGKTSWGSCSKKGNLNFHYKALFLPESLQDYLVIHELAHLVHLNHSRAFWKLVETHDPNWREHRQSLKTYA